MVERYPIPAQPWRVQEEIRRSRFITTVAPSPSVEQARDVIAGVRSEFAGATHNCWAYVVGPPGSTSQIGYSDDGEPHGTAGKPMFTVLAHSGIGDIVAVVTRYYGGVKLGKGGLVRAYSGGVKLALASLALAEYVPMAELTLVIEYADLTPLQRMLPEFEAELAAEDYAARVTLVVRLPEFHLQAFRQALIGLTAGSVTFV